MTRPSSTATDRLPPHSTEAEAALLGCIMIDPVNAMPEAVTSGVGPDWFYDLRHQRLFTTIAAMADSGEQVDFVTLADRLKVGGLLESIGGLGYLSTLTDATPSAANLPYYAGILKEKYLARKTIATCTKIVQDIYDDPSNAEALLDSAEASILSIRQLGNRREIPTMRDLALKVTGNIEARIAGVAGLETGFLDIDRKTNGGMKPGDFWVVAGRPSHGKTSWAMNVAEHVAARFLADWRKTAQPGQPYDGETVAVFSLEMTAEALAERMVASQSRVNTQKTILTGGDMPKLAHGVSVVSRLPVIIDDSVPLSASAIRARARRYYSKLKARLFIIDYLQLVASEPGSREENRRVQVDGISRGLKALAKELRVPVLAAAQLNRDIEKEGKPRKPRMSDLREAGGIEQDADLIGFLYADPEQDQDNLPEETPRSIFFRVGKQRNGPRDFDVPLIFLPQFVKFENAARIKECE